MRMVCQRVLEAEVSVNAQRVGKIDKGLLILLDFNRILEQEEIKKLKEIERN